MTRTKSENDKLQMDTDDISTNTAPDIRRKLDNKFNKQDYPNNFFKNDNFGPFGVWVKKITDNKHELTAYKVGCVVFKTYKSVIDIKNRGKFKVEILFKKRQEANKFLSDKSLDKHNLEAFIPGFRKYRKGVVRGVDLDIPVKDIIESISSKVDVIDVRRMKKKNNAATSKEDRWIESKSILLTFAGQNLPTEISIFFVKSNVEPFVEKPMQCFNCFKFNHTAKTCRSKKKCINCGHEAHGDSEGVCSKEVPCCVNCRASHKSNDPSCPVFQKYKQICTIMALENISFPEAKKRIFGEKQYAPPASKEHFPTINQHKVSEFSIEHTGTNKANSFYSLDLMSSQGSSGSSRYTSQENLTKPYLTAHNQMIPTQLFEDNNKNVNTTTAEILKKDLSLAVLDQCNQPQEATTTESLDNDIPLNVSLVTDESQPMRSSDDLDPNATPLLQNSTYKPNLKLQTNQRRKSYAQIYKEIKDSEQYIAYFEKNREWISAPLPENNNSSQCYTPSRKCLEALKKREEKNC